MPKKVLFALSKSTSNYTLKVVLSSEVINLIVTPPGIEPRAPAWEAGVLTAWLRGHIRFLCLFRLTRTLPSETVKPCFVLKVTPARIELTFSPWEGDFLLQLEEGAMREVRLSRGFTLPFEFHILFPFILYTYYNKNFIKNQFLLPFCQNNDRQEVLLRYKHLGH